MKKIYILALIAGALMFQSCLKSQEDLFDQTPSERMTQALKNYKEILPTAENGWLLEYYPERNQIYGGFAFVVKFTPSMVKAYTELADVTQSSEDTQYQLIADSGPVLSFDSYNSFLHFFSNPSGTNPNAFQGDFEFMLMGVSENKNEIKLQGKKTGNTMMLRRLTESPSTYLTKMLETEKKLDALIYRMTLGGKVIDFSLKDRVLSLKYTNDASEMVTEKIAYCPTDKGIRLYKPITVKESSVSEFILKDGNLTSPDGTVVANFLFPINTIFLQSTKVFTIYDKVNNIGEMSETVKAWVDAAYNGNMEQWGEEMRRIYINYSTVTKQSSIAFGSFNKTKNATYTSNFFYSATAVAGSDDKIKFGTDITKDANAKYYTHFETFVTKILGEGTYTLKGEPQKNPTKITFTSEKNPNIWFVLFK